jgi:glycerophosphoryl diester phosphodiesterase
MLIVGHRGARSIAPENTIRGIRAGLECADFVELDVRLSRDGIPVIIHDARLDRTTSGTGQVNDLTLKELKELDAGEGERIPTLEEVFQSLHGEKKGLFLEIKEPGSEIIICELIRDFPELKVVVVSFHGESLSTVKQVLPNLKTGIIVPNNHGHYHIDETWFLFDMILPKIDFLTPNIVEHARRSGIQVMPWTLNTRKEFKLAINLGVDGIITDNPCNAAHFIRAKGF